MLIDFSVKNFRSFKDKQTLTLVKDAGKEMAESNSFKVAAPADISLVRSTAIYGANGAGKSNLIDALRVFQRIVRESSRKISINDKLNVVPFRLSTDTENAPTEFEINFIINNVRYEFGFVADQHKILEEWLIAYPKRRPQIWYERTCNKKSTHWDFGSKLIGTKQTWSKLTRDNALFLSTAVQLNSRQLGPVYEWIIGAINIGGAERWGKEATAEMCANDIGKKQVLQFLAQADIDIIDLNAEKKTYDIDTLFAPQSEKERETIKQSLDSSFYEYLDIQTARYNNKRDKIVFDLETESLGTQKLFDLAGPWINALQNGHTLFIDEMNNHFHPKIIEHLISLFHNTETNKNNAQLVFTTHETSILNQHIFRRDQIWFVERDTTSGSSLFPLTDFSPRKSITNIESAYLSGRYGGIPYINKNSLQVAEIDASETYYSKKM
jgi:AAA15 family ATPase/GTPase